MLNNMNAILFNKLIKKIRYDTKAFDKLFAFYHDRIVNRLKHIYGETVAEETAQDFFMKLIMGGIKVEYINYPTSWVYKCCENIAKRKIYYESKEYEVLADSIDNSENDLYERQDIIIVLNDKLKDLYEDTQKIIVLHYWWGYTFKEISEILGINSGTVRTKHFRALLKLKKVFLEK